MNTFTNLHFTFYEQDGVTPDLIGMAYHNEQVFISMGLSEIDEYIRKYFPNENYESRIDTPMDATLVNRIRCVVAEALVDDRIERRKFEVALGIYPDNKETKEENQRVYAISHNTSFEQIDFWLREQFARVRDELRKAGYPEAADFMELRKDLAIK